MPHHIADVIFID